MAESKAMVKKEIGFMKKAGAPKSMIKHEESEMKGMKKGGSVKPSSMGKVVAGGKRPHGEHTVQQKGHTKGKQVVMAYHAVAAAHHVRDARVVGRDDYPVERPRRAPGARGSRGRAR